MEIKKNDYVLSFSSKKVEDFPKIFATLLEKMSINDSCLADFRLQCDKERIVINIPRHEKAFLFIAQIIREIDTFSLVYRGPSEDISDESTNSLKNETAKCKVESDVKQEESLVIRSEPDTSESYDEEVEKKSAVKKEKVTLPEETVLHEECAEIVEDNVKMVETSKKFSQTPDALENNDSSESNNCVQENVAKKPASKRRFSQSETYNRVWAYIDSKEEFSCNELRVNFPDVSTATINNIVYMAKSKGWVTPISKGKYKVVKE